MGHREGWRLGKRAGFVKGFAMGRWVDEFKASGGPIHPAIVRHTKKELPS